MTDKNGELPKGWKWVKLIEVSNLLSGGTPSRNNSQSFIGVIPWVKTLDLNCSVVQTTEEKISEEAFNEIRGKILPVGTVMVAMYGGVGTIGKSGILGIPATTNQAICSILPNPDLFIPEFLHAWLILIRSEWMLYSGGNRKDPNINKSVVEQMRFPLPPLPEQKRIVAILNEQMAAVEKARAAAEAQLQAAKTLPAAYLREVFDSPEAQKWERKPLGEVLLNIETGKSMSCDERPAKEDEWGILKVSAVSWGKFKPEQNKVIPRTFTPLSKYEVHSGDLIISRANTKELVGAIVLVGETESNLMLSDKTLRLVTNTNVEKAYIEIALREKTAREYIESIATGTSDSMRNISQENIKKIPIFLPSKSKQASIINYLNLKQSATENLCKALQDQLDTIKQLPAALLRQAFNGEL